MGWMTWLFVCVLWLLVLGAGWLFMYSAGEVSEDMDDDGKNKRQV